MQRPEYIDNMIEILEMLVKKYGLKQYPSITETNFSDFMDYVKKLEKGY